MAIRARIDTDEVFNQSPPYENVDLFASDVPLQDAIEANGVAQEAAALSAFGRHWGSAEVLALARQANENPPKLRSFDAKGHRSDTIEFHPAYHDLMRGSVAAGLHASTWTAAGQRASAPAEVARAARYYMVAQVESGHLCPITMTRAALAALAPEPALAAKIAGKVVSRSYDPAFRPWWEKSGMTLGMGMTEKQGGTDVRANITTATPDGDGYLICGHKWFLSAPMCDAFLVLAQAPGGLTCFLLPRFRPDGAVNGLQLQRLKDKLGNRSNASSEVEFADAFAWRVGAEGTGVRTIIQMVQLTRLDCVIASAGFMRMALAQAVHHCRYRSVFQRHLYDQPMMRAVLADLALDVEGALALAMRLARAFDAAGGDAIEAAYARIITPAAKYWVCKTAPGFIYEAMECLGGNGYVEESVLPRLYREAPVNAIWEGSGNVMCLDVLRALRRDELAGLFDRLSREADVPAAEAANLDAASEAGARETVGRLAVLAGAAALRGSAPSAVAEAFVRTRLVKPHGALYGATTLDTATIETLLQRALPEA
ncbi:MAG TPA: acyl-CoA dehydrogenase family protein [Xanthobacteraceae bacterium]|nr:acyl-CoA dehydrogenase family protein [Xanthobacteraceae bacterium]